VISFERAHGGRVPKRLVLLPAALRGDQGGGAISRHPRDPSSASRASPTCAPFILGRYAVQAEIVD